VIPNVFALVGDPIRLALVQSAESILFSGRARSTARQDRDLANNLLGMEPSAGQALSITSS
jgi:hypothetical protein